MADKVVPSSATLENDPLLYAIAVIENYQMDISHGIADGSIPEGFCQGSVYRDALGRIRRMQKHAPPNATGPHVRRSNPS